MSGTAIVLEVLDEPSIEIGQPIVVFCFSYRLRNKLVLDSFDLSFFHLNALIRYHIKKEAYLLDNKSKLLSIGITLIHS